jgi:hypothetical protein
VTLVQSGSRISPVFVAAVRYLLANGWTRTNHNASAMSKGAEMLGYFQNNRFDWTPFWVIQVDRTPIEVAGVEQAVDVLCGLGYLPAHMSTGWGAAEDRERRWADATRDGLEAEIQQLTNAIEAVRRLCKAYTAPEPPPILREPGLSEFGKGNNHGMKTMAQAVLEAIRTALEGERDEDACYSECSTTEEAK